MTAANVRSARTLVNRLLESSLAEAALDQVRSRPSIVLGPREGADLELIANGGYTPLEGFMARADYESVVGEMRLADGSPWPLPVTLSVGVGDRSKVKEGLDVGLADTGGQILGVFHVEEVYPYDKKREARLVFGTEDARHPGVSALYNQKDLLVGGRVSVIQRPHHGDFLQYRPDPAETRRIFEKRGWRTIVGFQTRNPIHRAHEYLHKCVMETYDGLFIHPVVGPTKDDDVPVEVRMACYEAIIEGYYPKDKVVLGVYPAAMRYAGPREAIFHALVRRNYGCTHFIVGRDHAGVGSYYQAYESHAIFSRFAGGELGIAPIFFDHSFFCRTCGTVASTKTCPHKEASHLVFSGTKVRELLRCGKDLPPEFTRPEVARVLREWVNRSA